MALTAALPVALPIALPVACCRTQCVTLSMVSKAFFQTMGWEKDNLIVVAKPKHKHKHKKVTFGSTG